MAVRTNSPAVVEILRDHYDGLASLTPFIAGASSITDKLATADVNAVHSAADLELIERWLAAWSYHAADLMYASKNTGGAGASFQGQTGMHFSNNYYGQMALILDTTGYLAKLQKQAEEGPKVAGGAWLGTRYRNDNSEQTSDQ